jgi:hypothetical protein
MNRRFREGKPSDNVAAAGLFVVAFINPGDRHATTKLGGADSWVFYDNGRRADHGSGSFINAGCSLGRSTTSDTAASWSRRASCETSSRASTRATPRR